MLPAVPLVLLHVISLFGHVMVVDVIVTPVYDFVPTVTPLHGKVELVVFKLRVPELYVYVPPALAETGAIPRNALARKAAIWSLVTYSEGQ